MPPERHNDSHKRGVVLSFFPNGYGFVRELSDPHDFHSAARGNKNYFYHISNSPNLDQPFVGMVVDFEVTINPRDWKEQAVNLTQVET